MHLGNTFSRVIIFRKRVLHLIKAFLLAFLFKKKKMFVTFGGNVD